MAPKNVLLVEGPDDLHFAVHILNRFGYTIDRDDKKSLIKVKHKDGVEKLLATLKEELDASDLERLGIVVDANGDCAGRWISIRDRLTSLGYAHVPKQLPESGYVVEQTYSLPSVGVWIMPDNRRPGYLEDYVSLLISNDDVWEFAVETVLKIPTEKRKFSDVKRVKAQIHTWLAWQAEPGKPIGQAITKGYFDLSHPSVATFIDWIKVTFALGLP